MKKAVKILRNNKALSLILGNRGITLIELTVTAAVGVIVTLGIASVFIFAMQQFTILVEKNTAEENSIQIAYYLKKYLSQAVDINAVDSVDPVFASTGNGTGQIDVNFELMIPSSTGIGAADTGEFARLATFNREAAIFNTNTNKLTDINGNPSGGSSIRTTGIFIKDTQVDGAIPDAQSGAVVFDVNSDGAMMMPSVSDLYFTRLHNLRVQRTPCPGADGYAVEVVINSAFADNGVTLTCLPAGWAPSPGRTYKIKTITFETFVRYFRSSIKSNWNYRAGDDGVPTDAPYRDLVQTVKINFKNNLLTTNSLTGPVGAEERVHGSLYFYDYIIPAVRN